MTNNKQVFNKLLNGNIECITYLMNNGYTFDDAFELVMNQSVAGPKVRDAIINHFTK